MWITILGIDMEASIQVTYLCTFLLNRKRFFLPVYIHPRSKTEKNWLLGILGKAAADDGWAPSNFRMNDRGLCQSLGENAEGMSGGCTKIRDLDFSILLDIKIILAGVEKLGEKYGGN